MSKRSARRDENFDLFIPRMNELPLKDQREMMERPFFSLAKRKRLKPIEYVSPDGEVRVHVSANPTFGIATIWDADILIWAASHLNRLRQRGENDLPRTIHTTAYDLLKAIKRDHGGRGYRELQAALQRLEATTIQTSIRAPKRKKLAQFGWLDEWTLEVDPETDAPRGLTITLSNWMFEGILADRGLLTLHPDYFLMSGGLERAIYRIARKHAGDQPDGWVVRISVLADKTGSESPLKQFTYLLRKIASRGGLLDYDINFEDAADGSAAVRFTRREAAERAQAEAEHRARSEAQLRRGREDRRRDEVDGLFESRRVR